MSQPISVSMSGAGAEMFANSFGKRQRLTPELNRFLGQVLLLFLFRSPCICCPARRVSQNWVFGLMQFRCEPEVACATHKAQGERRGGHVGVGELA